MTFAIISIEIGVIGLMALWNIHLDVITMIQLIMGIGFAVDFSAHISYHYLSNKGNEKLSPKDRLEHCLYAMGPPIVQGATTTALGTSGLLLHDRY